MRIDMHGFKRASIFCSGLTFLALFAVTSSGCAGIGKSTQGRDFVVENKWTRATTREEHLGFRRMNRMPPVILDQMVLQANSIDGLIAYSREGGRQIWRLDMKNGVEGGVQVVGDRIYFGSSDGQFYCVSLANGKPLWTFPVRAETLAPPTVDKGVVYFQSGADVVYALDAQTGKQLWLYNRQVTGNLSIRATTRPTVAGENLLVGFSDGFIVSLRKNDGGLVWERKIGRANRFQDVDSTPVVDGQSVYVASFDAALHSLDVESGGINWTVDEGAYVPVTVGQGRFSDRLFYSTVSGKILSVDKRSGKILNTVVVKRGIATQPTFFKGYLLYGESEGALVVADPESGAVISRFEPGTGLVARPSAIDATGEVYFISNAANLYSLRMGFRPAGQKLPWQ
jgi:outer membrane protein assembly factor BamB